MARIGSAEASIAKPKGRHDPTAPDESELGPYQPGAILGDKYCLGQLVAEGGMGSIWLAEHLDLQVEFALKLVHPSLARTTAPQRLQLEAQLAARLRHPSIVKVHDYGISEHGHAFLVMERLEGESLFQVLERERVLSEEYAVQLLLPVFDAISTAHAQGIVHRDLKPDNIMLATYGDRVIPKVLDFGIAKIAAPMDDCAPLSLRGEVIGTPEYMSPEQAGGRPDVDARADVWALSVVLYEMLSGSRPFAGAHHSTVMLRILDAPVPPLVGVDSSLSEIVLRGLSKDREVRWASARDMGKALAEWLVSRGVFEDITHASICSRWGVEGWRAPSSPPSVVSTIPPSVQGILDEPSSKRRASASRRYRMAVMGAAALSLLVSTGVVMHGAQPRLAWIGDVPEATTAIALDVTRTNLGRLVAKRSVSEPPAGADDETAVAVESLDVICDRQHAPARTVRAPRPRSDQPTGVSENHRTPKKRRKVDFGF